MIYTIDLSPYNLSTAISRFRPVGDSTESATTSEKSIQITFVSSPRRRGSRLDPRVKPEDDNKVVDFSFVSLEICHATGRSASGGKIS